MKIELTDMRFVPMMQYLINRQKSGDEIIDITEHGESKSYAIPSLYIKPNNSFEAGASFVKPGILLKMIATKNCLLFCCEISKYLLASDYNASKNQLAIFLDVERQKIIRFTKIGAVSFQGINPSLVNKFIGGLSNIPVPGIIGKLVAFGLFKGASKIAETIIDETIEKEGVEFLLEFEHENSVKKISIIAEGFYETFFDAFLNKHWKKEVEQ